MSSAPGILCTAGAGALQIAEHFRWGTLVHSLFLDWGCPLRQNELLAPNCYLVVERGVTEVVRTLEKDASSNAGGAAYRHFMARAWQNAS